MSNEPIDPFKGSESPQSPCYQEPIVQCDLCGVHTHESLVNQVSSSQHACSSCQNILNRFRPDPVDSVFHMQKEFLDAGDVPNPIIDKEDFDIVTSRQLCIDEVEEWSVEPYYLVNKNLNDLKECLDVIYTASQYMNQSVGAKKALQLYKAVHAHNMEKTIDGKLRKLPNGKIDKPDGFDKYSYRKTFEEILDADEF